MMNRKLVLVVWLTLGLAFGWWIERGQRAQDKRGVGRPESVSERRVALVIGNTDYAGSIGRLVNPANDAQDMAAACQRLGFELVGGKAQLNLNKKQMLNLIREFGAQIQAGGVGVFYFAGHGVQVDKHNYLLPLTDELTYQEDAEFAAVDVDQILREMEDAENSLKILILDACRNNNLPKRPKSRAVAEKGLGDPARKPAGILIAYAAADGQTAAENPTGRNGLFTQEVLKHLETPGLRVDDIFRLTRREVKRLSGDKQEPFVYESLDAPFFLKARDNLAAQSPANAPNSEAAFWQAIESSTELADFEQYLAKCRSGEFAGLYRATAELKLARLRKAKASVLWANIRPVAKSLLNYQTIFPLSDGLIGFEVNGRCGFIDKTGRVVIPPRYSPSAELDSDVPLCQFTDGLAAMRLNNRYGLINRKGQIVVPFRYDDIGLVHLLDKMFTEGLAAVVLNSKWGFIDRTGKEVILLKYNEVYPFSEGLAAVKLNEKWGFIDRTGKEVIPFKYDD